MRRSTTHIKNSMRTIKTTWTEYNLICLHVHMNIPLVVIVAWCSYENVGFKTGYLKTTLMEMLDGLYKVIYFNSVDGIHRSN